MGGGENMEEALRELTGIDALELLQRAVAEKGPDYVYVNPDGFKAGERQPDPEFGESDEVGTTSCFYFDHDDAPSCIVGHVFAWAGATKSDVREGDTPLGQEPYFAPGARVVGRKVDGFWYDAATAGVLGAAQTIQDGGGTWGQALDRATEVAMDSGILPE